jgi:hypothetical protein
MADKNSPVVAVSRHSGDSYILAFCANGDVFRLDINAVSGAITSKKVHELFHDEPTPQLRGPAE